ncbi:MAG: hypothetical protein FWH40_04160 [Coriobacteriia bacterium]|nr:hypothetical protein [Coriobacteriia bacterium]
MEDNGDTGQGQPKTSPDDSLTGLDKAADTDGLDVEDAPARRAVIVLATIVLAVFLFFLIKYWLERP